VHGKDFFMGNSSVIANAISAAPRRTEARQAAALIRRKRERKMLLLLLGSFTNLRDRSGDRAPVEQHFDTAAGPDSANARAVGAILQRLSEWSVPA